MFLLKKTWIKPIYNNLKQLSANFSGKPIDYNNILKIQEDDNLFRKLIMINEKHRNSLSLDMIRALQYGIDSINFDKCRVLIISSSSNKVFSSGHNLKELTSDRGENYHQKVFQEFTQLCLSLQQLPIPTIAQVSGLAAAAGLQLALSCDILIASSQASFSTPGVKFGIFCSTPAVPLSRMASSKISLKMLLTGEAINASEAHRSGLISELVLNENDIDQRIFEITKMIESNPKGVLALGKKSFYEQIKQNDMKNAYNLASNMMIENLKYEDTQSGLKAFASKTKPKWSHSNKKKDNCD